MTQRNTGKPLKCMFDVEETYSFCKIYKVSEYKLENGAWKLNPLRNAIIGYL